MGTSMAHCQAQQSTAQYRAPDSTVSSSADRQRKYNVDDRGQTHSTPSHTELQIMSSVEGNDSNQKSNQNRREKQRVWEKWQTTVQTQEIIFLWPNSNPNKTRDNAFSQHRSIVTVANFFIPFQLHVLQLILRVNFLLISSRNLECSTSAFFPF